MWILFTLLAITLALLYSFYRQRKAKQSLWRSLGIPGPEPHWLYGNAHLLVDEKIATLSAWSKQYGKTFGYFEGPVPVLYTADTDILKQVFVKDFSKFHARKHFPMTPPADSDKAHMFFSSGEKWKRLRTIINPTFSSAKLKQMFPLVEKKANILHSKFEDAAKSQEVVDVHRLYQCYTLDVIGEIAFGLHVDSQNDPNDPYLEHCMALFDAIGKGQQVIAYAAYVPVVGTLMWHVFDQIGGFVNRHVNWLHDQIGEVLDMRKLQKEKRVDLMQLMIDAEADLSTSQNLTMTEDDSPINEIASDTKPSSGGTVVNKQKLTVDEIKSMGELFLLAGFDTTSNSLAYITYLLATNPEELAKVHREIDEKLPATGPITYAHMKELTYMEMCLQESLRIYPVVVAAIDRRCSEECVVGSGIPFTPGMCVSANVPQVHNDPDLWGPVDPHKFHPQRFSPEEKSRRHPQAWIPFGGGPRNCVGMRFSIVETKLALATVLRDFTFLQCPETEVPLKLRLAATVQPVNGVKIKVAPRK